VGAGVGGKDTLQSNLHATLFFVFLFGERGPEVAALFWEIVYAGLKSVRYACVCVISVMGALFVMPKARRVMVDEHKSAFFSWRDTTTTHTDPGDCDSNTSSAVERDKKGFFYITYGAGIL
jgi:hypothetical protein